MLRPSKSRPAHVPVPYQEPRWPATLAVLAASALAWALPASVAPGPRGLLPAVVVGLLVPTVIAHHARRPRLNAFLGLATLVVLTAGLIAALVLLVVAAVRHAERPVALLGSALALWSSNVLIFASWYWRLDAGGPHQRELKAGHETGAFLFPQMTLDGPAGCERDGTPWSPRFIDYFFFAFNTSTAFSPTDVPVLARWAKVLMMLQSLLSVLIVALLAARAVNIL